MEEALDILTSKMGGPFFFLVNTNFGKFQDPYAPLSWGHCPTFNITQITPLLQHNSVNYLIQADFEPLYRWWDVREGGLDGVGWGQGSIFSTSAGVVLEESTHLWDKEIQI